MEFPQQQTYNINYSAIREKEKRDISHLIKIGVLIILTFGSAFLLGQFLSYSFYQNVFQLPDIAIPLIITFAVFLTFFFHSVLFIQNKKLLNFFAFGSWLVMGVSFVNLSSIPFFVGAFLCLVLFLFAVYETKSEIDTRIKIRFVHALNSVTTKIILAVAVLLASVLYGTLMTKELDENNYIFPKSAFQRSIPLVQSFAGSLFGGIDMQKSIRETAEQKVIESLEEQYGVSASQIPQNLKVQLTEQYVDQLRANFSGVLGTNVDVEKPLSDAMYDALLHKVNTLDPGVKAGTLLVLMILFIFSVQALSVVVRILLIPIAFAVYEILLRTKFAHIVYENASKEIVTI